MEGNKRKGSNEPGSSKKKAAIISKIKASFEFFQNLKTECFTTVFCHFSFTVFTKSTCCLTIDTTNLRGIILHSID